MKTQSKWEQAQWAGLDWGDSVHILVATDISGKKCPAIPAENSIQGLQELVDRLHRMPLLKGIAVETTRALVVHRLLQEGFRIYPVNPKMSAAWRDAWTVAGTKSDERDALALATGLAIQHETLRPLEPEAGLARELALLCEDEMNFIAERAGLVTKLTATLKMYYPAALQWFNDWTLSAAWEFVRKFPSAAHLAAASKKQLYAFLEAHRLRLTPQRRTALDTASQATTYQADEATVRAMAMRVCTVCAQLLALDKRINEYHKRIEGLFAQHPDATLFQSLPGAGKRMAPRLAAVFGTQRQRYESAAAIQQLSGLVPVTCTSGKQVIVKYRRAFNTFYRNTLYQYAFCSTRRCAWAKQFYDHRRACGDTHPAALRKLAAKWAKIIFRMWQTSTPYDEQHYVDNLKSKGSSLPCCAA